MSKKIFSLEVEGLARLKLTLSELREVILDGIEAAFYVEAEQLITEAKLLTPVDEGPLRASGHVQPPVTSDRSVEVRCGFGGPAGSGNLGGAANAEDVGYAVRVHEDLEVFGSSPGGGSRVANNPKRTFVGQAKYLEIPWQKRKAGIADRVAERVQRYLNKKMGK